MRLFVALDVPDEVGAALRDLTAQLQPLCGGARWVRVEGIHITLKFIGEVPPPKLEPIKAKLGEVATRGAFEMRFRGAGFFPNPRRPRVFWAGIEASPDLAALAGEIESRLEPLGIARESRAFKPHLTLARFNTAEGLPKLHAALEKLGALEFGAARAEEFHLYQSELKRGGAVYTRLATFPFVEPK